MTTKRTGDAPSLPRSPEPVLSSSSTATGRKTLGLDELHFLDLEKFRRHLLFRRRLKPITAKRVIERLTFAVRHGFQLGRFVRDEASAEDAGEAWLERRLADGAGRVYAFNNDVKVLNALAAYLGFKEVRFSMQKEPAVAPRALSELQFKALLDLHHPDRRADLLWRAVALLESEAGLRVSELASLDLQDLDAENSRIHVRRPAKGGMVRWLPMPRWIWSPRRALGAWLAARPPFPTKDSGPLWVTQHNTARDHVELRAADGDTLRRIFWHVSKRLGFRVNCNILRHTVATRLKRRDFDILAIKLFLGHARLTSTQVYAEMSPEDLELLFRRRPSPDPFLTGKGP